MQPGNAQAPLGGEQVVTPNVIVPSSADRLPVLPMPEAPKGGLETGAERREQVAEVQAAKADAASVASSTTQTGVDPGNNPILSAQASQDDVSSTTPITAAHDDVIEKEWVDKAKQIIATTKDDPYQRGEQVNALQKDYLKKRYGKDLGAAAS